ncbi:hypothetical protein ABW20_dc0109433 [Dactylellina cionopaga]|nr:hypothetical protein ABW20_dc0109433 [Dactylellina cionopaga]
MLKSIYSALSNISTIITSPSFPSSSSSPSSKSQSKQAMPTKNPHLESLLYSELYHVFHNKQFAHGSTESRRKRMHRAFQGPFLTHWVKEFCTRTNSQQQIVSPTIDHIIDKLVVTTSPVNMNMQNAMMRFPHIFKSVRAKFEYQESDAEEDDDDGGQTGGVGDEMRGDRETRSIVPPGLMDCDDLEPEHPSFQQLPQTGVNEPAAEASELTVFKVEVSDGREKKSNPRKDEFALNSDFIPLSASLSPLPLITVGKSRGKTGRGRKRSTSKRSKKKSNKEEKIEEGSEVLKLTGKKKRKGKKHKRMQTRRRQAKEKLAKVEARMKEMNNEPEKKQESGQKPDEKEKKEEIKAMSNIGALRPAAAASGMHYTVLQEKLRTSPSKGSVFNPPVTHLPSQAASVDDESEPAWSSLSAFQPMTAIQQASAPSAPSAAHRGAISGSPPPPPPFMPPPQTPLPPPPPLPRDQSVLPSPIVHTKGHRSASLSLLSIPYPVQHKFLNEAQKILEQVCYDFVARWLPQKLSEAQFSHPENAELTMWVRLIKNYYLAISPHAWDDTDARAHNMTGSRWFSEIVYIIERVRHTAVHRLHTDYVVLLGMMEMTVTFARFLKDTERAAQLQQMVASMHSVSKWLEAGGSYTLAGGSIVLH